MAAKGCLFLIILMMEVNVCFSYEQTFYRRIDDDVGTKINATFTTFPLINKFSCAVKCNLTPTCLVFSWDSQRKECGLMLDELTSLITTIAAPITLVSYHAIRVGGKEIFVIQDSWNIWSECKSLCEEAGGHLHFPLDTTFIHIIHHVFKSNYLAIGMYRDPQDNDTNTWYDMDRNIITEFPTWYPGQPNNSGGFQYYGTLWEGLLDDMAITRKCSCLCER